MAKKGEAKKVGEIKRHIRADLAWREKWASVKDWGRWENYYRDLFTGDKIDAVNIYFPTIRGLVPQVYFRNPGVQVENATPGSDIKAKIVECVDNWLINVSKIKKELQMAAQDTFLCGLCPVIHGYDSEHGFFDPRAKAPTMLSKDGKRIEYRSTISPGMPWSLRAHPIDVLLPWGTVSPRNLRGFTLRKIRLLEDIKADEKYGSAARKAVKASSIKDLYQDESLEESLGIDTSEEWGCLYERHDFREHKITVIADNCDKILKEAPDYLAIISGRLPISLLIWNPNSRSVYGVPDAKVLEGYQLEMNDANTQATRQRRFSTLKGLVAEGAFSEEELDKLTSDKIGAIATVQQNFDLDQAYKEIAGTPNTFLRMELEAIRAQARQAVGFSRTRSGDYTHPTKRVTAKEVQAVEFGEEIRASARRDAIADLLSDTVHMWNQMIFTFWDEPRMIRAPGIAPGIDWVIFRGTDLRSTYTYRISPEELRTPSKESERSEAATIGPLLMKLASSAPEGFNVMEVFHQIMSRFPSWDVNKMLRQAQPAPAGGVAQLTPDGHLIPFKTGAQKGANRQALVAGR